MATFKIKTSELSRMIKESVQKVLKESAFETIPEEAMEEELTMEQLKEMVKTTVSEAFGEKGDHNGTHTGGTFGDAEKKPDPIAEAKKQKEKVFLHGLKEKAKPLRKKMMTERKN